MGKDSICQQQKQLSTSSVQTYMHRILYSANLSRMEFLPANAFHSLTKIPEDDEDM
jgi:hypothetical protein